MNGLPQHARIVAPEYDGVRCSCPCGWSVLLPARSGVREEAEAHFREHMATVNMAPTPDRFTAALSVRPGITIPPLTLLVFYSVQAAMWALILVIGAAVIGVLR